VPARQESARLPARYIARLLDFLASIGVERHSLLREARIRAIDDPGAQVSVRQVEALLAAAGARTGRTDLGFELGLQLDPTSHDLLGFALLTSPTFGDMLRLATTYQRLMQAMFAVRLQPGTESVELIYTPVVAMPPLTLRALEESIVISNHLAYRTALGRRTPPYEAWLSIARPPHVARYRELIGARVHFGEALPGVRIVLPASVLDAPLAMADARAMRAAEARCKALLQQVHARRSWTDWCRMMLRESEDARPTLEQLARIVNVSPRTLARYLAAEGESFRELSLAVRSERATALLQQGDLSVTQVAYRLGYGDAPSFVRCYRKETGRTPGAVVTRTTARHPQSARNRAMRRPARPR
jgi:AraC-like DNA-binding protein